MVLALEGYSKGRKDMSEGIKWSLGNGHRRLWDQAILLLRGIGERILAMNNVIQEADSECMIGWKPLPYAWVKLKLIVLLMLQQEKWKHEV
ncbi:conserved hypothetical protein [Ricinus communis]|uniref:Uncharacterized protein n=1 Tax=Ricinus communis TaxID=3988 RepID=B9RXY8_RICCO|nr:conserved hypothetical protein [Ricinus communis]